MSHSSVDPFQSRRLPIVHEENDPYRIVKKSPRNLDSNISDFDIVHSRTASDSSTSKLHNFAIDSSDPYLHYKKQKVLNKEPDRVNSYLPYSNHNRDLSQPFSSFMYIEDDTPRASTTLGVGSMLYDNLSEQPNPTRPQPTDSTDDKQDMMKLPKKKRRRQFCCGLGYRSIALIVVLCLGVIIIIWYFVWPRLPSLSVSDVSDDSNIVVITNSTTNVIFAQWNMSLTADNTANWVPTRFNSIDLVMYDQKTSVVVGNGSSGSLVLPAKKKSLITVLLNLQYESSTINDATFQDLYNACGVQVSSSTPSDNTQDVLNMTLYVEYHIAGIVWTPTANISVYGLNCPTS